MNKTYAALLLSTLIGCSALTGIAKDAAIGAVTGSNDKGIELTAQVGKSNNKGLIATSVDTSKDVEIDDVQGDAVIDSGNSKSVENEGWTMIGLVLAGMSLPMLMLFYLLPSPRWLNRRYKDTPE